jgi:flagellar hook protein FlgE
MSIIQASQQLANFAKTMEDSITTRASQIPNSNVVGSKASKISFNSFLGGVQSTTTINPEERGGVDKNNNYPSTYMALSEGKGMFTVQSSSGSAFPDGTSQGDFNLKDGIIQNSSGKVLMGIPVNSSGQLPAGGVTFANLVPATISPSQQNSAGIPTQNVSVVAQLPSNMANNTVKTFPVRVYGSQGIPHQLSAQFTQTATKNEWNFSMIDDQGNASGSVPIIFDSSGKLQSVNGIAQSTYSVNFDFSSSGESNAQSITFNFGAIGTLQGLIQQDVPSQDIRVLQVTQDGKSVGTLQDLTVVGDQIVAEYTNGSKVPLYKLAALHAQNAKEMKAMDSNCFSVTTLSGTTTLEMFGQNGIASVESRALEKTGINETDEIVGVTGNSQQLQITYRLIGNMNENLKGLTNII